MVWGLDPLESWYISVLIWSNRGNSCSGDVAGDVSFPPWSCRPMHDVCATWTSISST